MVVPEKDAGSDGPATIVDCVSLIMGIHNLKSISPNSTLSELGLDSLTVVEVKQSLEREFGIFLMPKEIRSLTFARLNEMAEKGKEELASQALSVDDGPSEELQLLLSVIGDEASSAQPVVCLPAAGGWVDVEDEMKAGPFLFMLPGIDGTASVLEPLAKNLKYQTMCLQLNYRDIGETIQDMVQSLLSKLVVS
ncbi:fatty acid synthase-like [Cryptotermes secundus]|uniref:fatty acid synthase-like n=1 Tax=Cryptotermes secundus TaxID=105785 RepID=UPI000CD7C33F|nr:fatty acid synthase-like [Cryptotermes secundus]